MYLTTAKSCFKSTNGSVSIAHSTSGDDRIVDLQATGGSGTVTSVAAGNGMNFTTITGSGSFDNGDSSSRLQVSTDAVSTGTHYSLNNTPELRQAVIQMQT